MLTINLFLGVNRVTAVSTVYVDYFMFYIFKEKCLGFIA